MMRRKALGLASVAAVAALGLAACGGGSSSSGGGGTAAAYNAAVTSVVNPSTHKGGTINYGMSSTPDSFDPGNTYYAWVWNFSRLYAQALLTYKSCPGQCGLQLVPRLATSLGSVSSDGLTWTFHIRPNVKFSDGTTVTSQDVKYAIERTYDRSVMANGPNYFQVLLTDPTYPGPYKDKTPGKLGLTAIDTPDATTLVFHLQHPFADFPYVLAMPQTAPVPPAKDTGSNYQLNIVSTGPYMFQSYQLNKQAVLVPNPDWSAAQDPNAKQLASKIVITLNMNANDIDNRLLAGDLNVDAAGTGVQTAARAKILSSPSLMKQADDPVNGFQFFTYINTKVPPLNNVNCRQAILYAYNKQSMQTAYGGPVQGQIATTAMPPNIEGYQSFDLYNAKSKPTGDVAAAKAALAKCGQPNGFSTTMAYRSDRPREAQVAQSLQQSLAAVGIKLTLQGFPSGTYYTDFSGAPKYVHQHGLGLNIGGWGADWPDGYGFLDELFNGNAIVPTGNTNISELNDPTVNSLFTKATTTTSVSARNAIWAQIDKAVMQQAVIVPGVYAKALLYRSPNLTNVYVQPYYGMYNYAVLGTK
ncbi:MAG TPA: ABC transporter substrate-binding protein [Actinobacteria bacterium]|nr:ABC transporter substrate-binding protein [Actinomycetota bacterium]